MAKKLLIPGSTVNGTVEKLLTTMGYEVVKDQKPDALVLTGGGDINPRLYYEAPHAKTTYPQIDRDQEEMSAVIAARAHQIPVIGICRGFQLIHVANGGRLVQDVEGHRNTSHRIGIQVDYEDEVRSRFNHEWDNVRVNSLHHQAVPMKEALDQYEFVMSSRPPSEVITTPPTVEVYFDRRMKVGGVQYHPEYSTASEESVRVFKTIIDTLIEA